MNAKLNISLVMHSEHMTIPIDLLLTHRWTLEYLSTSWWIGLRVFETHIDNQCYAREDDNEPEDESEGNHLSQK